MLSGELSAVDTTARFPVADPVADGAKVTSNVTLCFEESIIGKLSPLNEKPVPLMFACEMVTVDPPVLVNVSERLELLLFCTLPKERADDDAARVEPPPLDPEPAEASPWHPVSSAIPVAIKRARNKRRQIRRSCKGPIPLAVLAFSTGTQSPPRRGFSDSSVFGESEFNDVSKVVELEVSEYHAMLSAIRSDT